MNLANSLRYAFPAWLLCAWSIQAQRMPDFHIPTPVAPGSTIVIGFLGGFEGWNNPHRSVRKLALDLRDRRIPGVYAETIENRNRALAVKLIRKATVVKGKHRRKSIVPNVRVILYGQSLGGAAVVYTARELAKLGEDVALTVQIDSVGLHDSLIPANVHAAANLYQHDWFTINGNEEIRAEDPSRTRIIENTRLTYLFQPFDPASEKDLSWIRRNWGGSHAKLEADERVWRHVEDLILSAMK